MLNKNVMQDRIKQLDREINSKIKEKMDLQDKCFKMYELEEIKEKYLNKYYIFRNNCYSCPEKKSDYWNVYYKVIEINDNGGIVAVSLQKDKYGRIESEIKTISKECLNLEEITEKDYIKETSKILGILQERFV